jgi:hypothetical protein
MVSRNNQHSSPLFHQSIHVCCNPGGRLQRRHDQVHRARTTTNYNLPQLHAVGRPPVSVAIARMRNGTARRVGHRRRTRWPDWPHCRVRCPRRGESRVLQRVRRRSALASHSTTPRGPLEQHDASGITRISPSTTIQLTAVIAGHLPVRTASRVLSRSHTDSRSCHFKIQSPSGHNR